MKKLDCILLIDDNPADNEFHKIIINDAKVCDKIKVATSGKMALEYIIKAAEDSENYPKPDLIFLDINMPGMNGFDFLEEYHKLGAELKSKIVIIMLSTSLNPDDMERAKEFEEVTSFINKPLAVDILCETVKKYF